ncbi:MAG: Hsp20/alpha crystallin family protein [Thermomicrobiales bacterium]|nr:Hsp20/alpha crystallin family protein [Thermomicrobiales bacterium]
MIRSPLFSDMLALRDSVDRFVSEGFGGDPFRVIWSRGGNPQAVAQPIPMDVYATEDTVVILAAIPGMRPDDLELSVHQNTVTLSGAVGNVPDTEEAKGATWYIHELSSGSFRRSVTLPFPVDADRAEASFEHGILRVNLPKAETAKPRKIAVTSGRPQGIEAGSTIEQ